ncbi:flagellar assembly protein FliH [Paenibacillus albiflavus]|uniref:Flagellar assembly protein FliH n=1 Tax=Paenibacillus albiflavus TaxID=2545760 RepID=A0A4V2WPL9_9BACL|nr:flagellar assembly protein FliH [Paenibacillus albiflavus]
MSNLIKPSGYQPLDNKKIIEFKVMQLPLEHIEDAESVEDLATHKLVQDAKRMESQILRDAEMVAEDEIRKALEETTAMREQAESDIEAWWTERRSMDETTHEEMKQAGFNQGYEEGLAKAEAELLAKYESLLEDARATLTGAHAVKDQIIHESEPFLIDLSSSIAERIIGHQLTVKPEWILDLVHKVLARRKEKGIITLCVSPKHFDYIFSAREELATSIDSQAELQILPDNTVGDDGCVVRSDYGSIDARIDTQLNEIKSALLHMAVSDEGVGA